MSARVLRAWINQTEVGTLKEVAGLLLDAAANLDLAKGTADR